MSNLSRLDQLLSAVIDIADRSMRTINEAHEKVHQGRTFTAVMEDSKGATVPSDMVISTTGLPIDEEIHLSLSISANLAGEVRFCEGPVLSSTVGSSGANLTILNHKRGSTKISRMQVINNPVLTSTTTGNTGLLLSALKIGSGNFPFTVGGQVGNRNEWILNSGDRWLVRFIPDLNGTDIINTIIFYVKGIENG